MGASVSSLLGYSGAQVECSSDEPPVKKRRIDADQNDEEDSLQYTPRKKKIRTTSNYIYQVLFVKGENTDITVRALGKEWFLHKLYLKQCGYFVSMFSGLWKESNANEVTLDIPDSNIDVEALSDAFGCLYKDEFSVEPARAIPLLAAASLLQMDDLMLQCGDIMVDSITSKNVCEYFEAAKIYGVNPVLRECVVWLENNIMCKQSASLLRKICPEMMTQLVKSPDLFVTQVEMDVYNLLKRWLILQICPTWCDSFKSGLMKKADSHFKELLEKEFGPDGKPSLLDTSIGSKYREVFASLRLEHIIIDRASTELMMTDRIIPTEWLSPFFESQWHLMLNIEHGQASGPNTEDVSKLEFQNFSLRCGRILTKDHDYQWRWVGFNYGIDLVVLYQSRMIIFKRNCTNQNRLLANQSYRRLMFRLRVSCVNELGHVTYTKATNIKSHNFAKDEELVVMNLEKQAKFPIKISLNVLYYTPPESRPDLLTIPSPQHREKFSPGCSGVDSVTHAPSAAAVPSCTPEQCPVIPSLSIEDHNDSQCQNNVGEGNSSSDSQSP